jgi:hypothetical protein
MTTITELAAKCTCGHMILVHHLTPSRIRSYCTFMGPQGACRCERAVVADG